MKVLQETATKLVLKLGVPLLNHGTCTIDRAAGQVTVAAHMFMWPRRRTVSLDEVQAVELYRGEATPLADVYALGATMHHALTKRDPRLEPPFSFAERPARKINPAISPELEAIINTALQYNPADRFPPGSMELIF